MILPKIGVSAIGYECAEHLDEVLKPWIEFNKKYKNIVISVCHGIFPETARLGFPLLSTDGTIDKLNNYKENKFIKEFIVLDSPTYEKDIRNHTLPALFEEDIDYLWLLDLQDEIYTEQDIFRIINFLQKTELISFFKINFKNYVFDHNHYVEDFVAPRIWSNKLNQGILGFYYDNEVLFKNNKKANETSCISIPNNIAFIKHLSWVGSKQYLKRKIEFQKIHYGLCSYKWNDQENKLDFDNEYYKNNGKQIPVVYLEEDLNNKHTLPK